MKGSECKESEGEDEGIQGTYSDAMKTVMLSGGNFRFRMNFQISNEILHIFRGDTMPLDSGGQVMNW